MFDDGVIADKVSILPRSPLAYLVHHPLQGPAKPTRLLLLATKVSAYMFRSNLLRCGNGVLIFELL